MEELRKLLEEADDKFEFIANKDNIAGKGITFNNILELINEFLTDEEKAKCLRVDYLTSINSIFNIKLLNSIKDDDIKFRLLCDYNLIGDLEINKYDIIHIINSLSEDKKLDLISNCDLILKYDFHTHEVVNIINSLSDDNKLRVIKDENLREKFGIGEFYIENIIINFEENRRIELLKDKDLIEKIGLSDFYIAQCINSLNSDEEKMKFFSLYEFSSSDISDIVCTFSDANKVKIILENKYNFSNYDLLSIISSLDEDNLVDFFNNNKEFIEENNIKLYKVILFVFNDKKINLVHNLDKFDCDDLDKVKVIATLKKEEKENLDVARINPKYRYALDIKTSEVPSKLDKIEIDFTKDMKIYEGLDDIIYVNAATISDEDKEKFLELCSICPNMDVNSNFGIGKSTPQEYINGEKWIDEILSNMDDSFSNIQKIAYIDHMIGKKISYSPDFESEVSDCDGARALWKIIDSGYGVCNGIANLEKYIFDRVGIECEFVSSLNHSFIKLKNMEIKDKDGNVKVGDTILDPTWNLAAHRFDGRPNNFCISYETARKHDINSDGVDSFAHKNDKELSDVTLELDDESLRDVYSSLGLIDKEGHFIISKMIDESRNSFDPSLSMEENISRKLDILKKYCPEFAICQESSMEILRNILLSDENLKYDDCVINRVFDKSDADKVAKFYIYANLKDEGKVFYVADGDDFSRMSLDEFEREYDSYEEDIKRNGGFRAWENNERIVDDLSKSSGTIVCEREDER